MESITAIATPYLIPENKGHKSQTKHTHMSKRWSKSYACIQLMKIDNFVLQYDFRQKKKRNISSIQNNKAKEKQGGNLALDTVGLIISKINNNNKSHQHK